MFKKLKALFKKRMMATAKMQEAEGPIVAGEIWQIGNKYFKVQKILPKNRVVVKLIKVG